MREKRFDEFLVAAAEQISAVVFEAGERAADRIPEGVAAIGSARWQQFSQQASTEVRAVQRHQQQWCGDQQGNPGPIQYSQLEEGYQDASIAIEAVRAGLAGLVDHAPQLVSRMSSLERDLEALRVSSARSPLLQLRVGLHELVAQLDEFTRGIRDRKDALSQQYRRAYDAITLNAIVGGSLGVLLFGEAATLQRIFFVGMIVAGIVGLKLVS